MPSEEVSPPQVGMRTHMGVDDPIDRLWLTPHPEGGWYRQTWVSPITITLDDGRVRPTATLILFFLPAGESSAWHVVRSSEHWLAHTGSVTLELGGDGPEPDVARIERFVITPEGEPQLSIPADVWQRTVPTGEDALVSCMVSPGFSFDDFALAREV